jgi:hypothetical protein
MFGGWQGDSVLGGGYLNDMWAFDPIRRQWILWGDGSKGISNTNRCATNDEEKLLVCDVTTGALPQKSVILKMDLLLACQKQRCCLDTESKCKYEYDNEGPTSTTVILKMA